MIFILGTLFFVLILVVYKSMFYAIAPWAIVGLSFLGTPALLFFVAFIGMVVFALIKYLKILQKKRNLEEEPMRALMTIFASIIFCIILNLILIAVSVLVAILFNIKY